MGINPWDNLKLTSAVGALNIIKTDEYFDLEIAVPGFSKEDISLELTGDRLVAHGEKNEKFKGDARYLINGFGTSSFLRSFKLVPEIDENNIKADYNNGILKIRLHLIPNHKLKEAAKQVVNIN